MLVQLRSCAPVRTHPLSVRHAIHLGCLLYRSHVCSAQEHAEDGTEAFKEVLMLAEAMRHRRSNNCSKKGNEEDIGLTRLWQRALTSYHDSAAAAQDGVLFLLTHNIAVHGGAPLIPLRAAEEDAFVQVAVAAQQAQSHAELGGTVAVGEAVLASMRLRGSSGAYFNHVLLTQQWDTSLCEGQSAVMQTVKAVEGGDATLAPARAALRWRTFLGSRQDRQPHAGVGADAAFNVATTLQPTPLQWILYTLRRQLIVAVANTAQVMLTGQRLHLDGTSSSSFSLSSNPPTPPLSVSCLRAHATSCVKAQALLRGLIRWHCPYPVPLPLLHHHNSRNGKVIASATDVVQQDAAEELLWCLRLMAKLHFRAAALYGAAGDVSRQQEQLRRWQDQLQRWNSRRAAHLPEGREETSRGDTAVSWSTSVEDVAGHVEAAAWAVFAKEASTGLPVAR
ncbi:hypothetical protein ABB37_08078 [Leptomonas pyrrhocoris]|uniref:Uncharacterized protein n=1 Tax=Leptomonas pyrrhocoris TaxID=157538 RepID=A0A0N0DSP6_LEPPY|nr:hypothetical protein ABB37_08078 [Leptomonas pyrrhocoris]KPA75904.1 hypothetical protein ABB37_08078 [Leptomonas pyrrhocoris]|eukprot:XP_015654343.1 hypothetical protein ABB37_08078 [Leptomonas pyrrhocoris]